jgi:hypothetical protein
VAVGHPQQTPLDLLVQTDHRLVEQGAERRLAAAAEGLDPLAAAKGERRLAQQ